MHEAILAMIERRRPRDQPDWHRALREVLQETALAGLWRTGFFDQAAFYGGTALHLFHGLDRFSEDLDFSLLTPNPTWKLAERLKGLRAEIEAFGFAVDIEPKHEGKIDSAFIKANTKIHLVRIEAPEAVAGAAASNRLVKVKLEIDTDPPAGIRTETKTLLDERIGAIDWKQAVEDVLPFVRDPRAVEMWEAALFREAAGRIDYGGTLYSPPP